MPEAKSTPAAVAIATWLERMRGDGGYGGPVAHWWRDQLLDCRPGFDWRYEGIISGYVALAEQTGDPAWLGAASRGGDDLLAAQLADGHFRQSRFELNPGWGGTPHEAAAAAALLRLGQALRERDPSLAEQYRAAAKRTIDRQIADLWDPDARSFRDDPARASFVPNKACTTIEALALLAEATGDGRYVEQYLAPTAEAVVALQVRRRGSRCDGAIAQGRLGGQTPARYLPYYVARCVPGLLTAHRLTGDSRYADAALAAGRFVARWQRPDGGFPQVVYDNGELNLAPRWVAALGDVLRAFVMLRAYGLTVDLAATHDYLCAGLLPTGAVMTARGFAAQACGRVDARETELRDLLPVAGWMDKALRYLAGRLDVPAPPHQAGFETPCTFLGRPLVFALDHEAITVRERGRVVYSWRLGADWPDIAEPWFAAR